MAERVFVDTNVLLYADDLDAGERRETAQNLLYQLYVDGTGVISTQVLQEFFVASTRRLGVPADIARRKVELLARLDVCRLRVSLTAEAGERGDPGPTAQ